MKILFDHPSPFLLAHGGFQTQIEETKAALEKIGIEVEFLRWWDAEQRGDLVHFFAPASTAYLKQAQLRRLPVVMTSLLTDTCNRSDARLKRQGWLRRLILAVPGTKGITDQLTWRSFDFCAHNVVGLGAERKVLEVVYDIPSDRISEIPLGLSDAYLAAGVGERRETHLICTGTITQRKNSVELAEMARATATPILFVGKPYHESDPYWLQFQRLIDDRCVKYQPHVNYEDEMVKLLHDARGFVLLSDYENWCLAAHEAAACGLPLLLPKQNWSLERFGTEASYFSGENMAANLAALKAFYDRSLSASAPQIKLYSWMEVAQQLRKVYERVLSNSQ